MKRIRIGSFFTDTATILIGDPCQFIRDERDFGEKRKELNYMEFVDMWQAQAKKVPGFFMPVEPNHIEIPNRHNGVAGIAVRTGSDGWYPVYLEYDEDDQEPVRVVIELGGKVSPGR
jgi:hypothetical protein